MRERKERERKEREISENVPTEQDYVARELEATRAMVARERENERKNLVTLADRLENAERYARWRHREYIAGRVTSL